MTWEDTPKLNRRPAQSTGDVECTDSISAEGLTSPNECPLYDTDLSHGEALVMLELRWMPLLLGPLWPGVAVLYSHIHIYMALCLIEAKSFVNYYTHIHAEYILTQWIKTSEDFFKKIYLSLYLKGLLCVRGSWRPNRTATYWPALLGPSALCLSCSLGLPNGRPGVRAFSTESCHQRVSKLNRGSQRPLLPGGGFLYHILSLTHLSPTHWLPVFTELYNSSIAHSIFGMACLIVIKRK